MNARDLMFDADCRVEELIYLLGMGDGDSHTEKFEDFCESLPEKADHPLYQQLPALARYADGEDYPEADEVFQALLFTPGFLVQAATPCRRYYADGEAFYSGWGSYYTAWLHAAAESDIAAVCVAWAETQHAKDKASALSATRADDLGKREGV